MGQMILLLMGHCSASHVAFGRSYVRYSFLRHTLYWWWVYDHYHVHLQLWYSAWLHLSTWGFWHPLTSHDSHPFHITQGISPSFFSHLPVQNSLLSFGKPILFLSAQPSRDRKLVSALPVWAAPLSHRLWADSNFNGAPSFTRPLVSSFCFPGMGMLDTIVYTSSRPVRTPGEERMWNSLRAKGKQGSELLLSMSKIRAKWYQK